LKLTSNLSTLKTSKMPRNFTSTHGNHCLVLPLLEGRTGTELKAEFETSFQSSSFSSAGSPQNQAREQVCEPGVKLVKLHRPALHANPPRGGVMNMPTSRRKKIWRRVMANAYTLSAVLMLIIADTTVVEGRRVLIASKV